jgi:hypothetical protein
MVINRAADQASIKSPAQNFTGNVRVASLCAERAPLAGPNLVPEDIQRCSERAASVVGNQLTYAYFSLVDSA